MGKRLNIGVGMVTTMAGYKNGRGKGNKIIYAHYRYVIIIDTLKILNKLPVLPKPLSLWMARAL